MMDGRGSYLREAGSPSVRPDGRPVRMPVQSSASPAPWGNLVELAQHRARHHGDRVAFRFLKDGETEIDVLTYGDLDQRARLAAAELRRRGVTGERVLLVYPQTLDFVVAFFAVLYAGGAAVPAPRPQGNKSSGARLRAIVEDARPKAVLTTPPLLAEINELLAPHAGALEVTTLDNLQRDSDSDEPGQTIAADQIALLQYTSGSTGIPRGVMISHANILHNQELIRLRFDHTEETVTIGWLPMFHDMGLIGNVLQPIYLGGSCVLMSPVSFLQEPVRWLEAISRYRGTTAGAPNFAYDLCVDRIGPEHRAGLDLSTWDIAYNGSEPVRAETLARFTEAFAPFGFRRETFYPCYGMAEATLLIAGVDKAAAPVLHRVEPDDADRDASPRVLVGCGRTGLGQELRIVDPETHQPLPDGKIGEIWLAGESVASGYWNRPDETRSTFGATLAGTADGRFLRTGDLGFLMDGEIFVTGRMKDVIIVRGRNHYPQDIEATVQSCHPDLRRDCGAAFLVESGEREVLVVVQEVARRWVRKPPVREIAGAIRAAVSREHGLHVAAVVLLKTGGIPKTTSGKIQRRLCRTSYLAGDLPVVAEDHRGSGLAGRPEPDRGLPSETAPGAGPANSALIAHKQIGI